MPSSADPHPAPAGHGRLRPVWAALAVAALAVAAYHDALRGEFAFDDSSSILENASIRTLWPPTVPLAPPPHAGVGARPLANLSYALNFALSGTDPWAYRATSIALHAVCAMLLFGLVRRTLALPGFDERIRRRSLPLAAASAGLWAVHPLTTSTVDYVSQRTEALMATACLALLLCLVRAATATGVVARRCWSLLAIAAAIAGMGSKETMVVAPVLALLFDGTFVAGSFRAALAARWRLHLALAVTWLVLAALMFASPVGQRGVGTGQGVGILGYAVTSAVTLLRYLRLAAWPDPLVFDYGWAFERGIPGIALAGAATAAGLFIVFLRWPRGGFAGAAFLLLLAPTTSIVPIVQQPIAESRMYLPLAGLVVAAVCGVQRLLSPAPFAAAMALAALVLGAATHRRHAAYRTEVSLWRDTVAKRPASARAHGNLGTALLRADRAEESLAASAEAIRLKPDYVEGHINLGVAHDRTGRPAQAIPHYEAALRLVPDDARAHYNLGNALVATGRTADAVASFASAARLNPHLAEAHYNLGILALRAGRRDEALAHLAAALRARPDYADAQRALDRARTMR